MTFEFTRLTCYFEGEAAESADNEDATFAARPGMG